MNASPASHQAETQELKKLGRVSWSCVTNYLSLGLGAGVILLAIASFVTDMALSDILEWVSAYFSISFALCFVALVTLGLLALYKVHCNERCEFWFEVGQQAGNGISTLALTFTLLGISMGIGTLAGQNLSPETVNALIGELTTQFSLAFMTTVVGLPTAALIRALISIRYAAISTNENFCEFGTSQINETKIQTSDSDK